MSITGILSAAAVVGAVGIFVGLFLGVAGIRFKVEKDEKEEANTLFGTLVQGDVLKLSQLVPGQHLTQPPAHYTEASLVKALEEQGIGEEDEITVCELFDQYVRQGREEGMQEGRAEGRQEGIVEGEARRLVADIENAMKFFQVTLERACEALGTTVSKYEEARKLI